MKMLCFKEFIGICTKRNFAIFATMLILIVFGSSDVMAQGVNVSPNEVGFKVSLEGESFGNAVNIFLLMTVLSLVPAMIMMLTSFTRIVIVLSFLKKAMGSGQAPSQKIIAALALFLSIFIMQPVWTSVYHNAILPYTNKEISSDVAIDKGIIPVKNFMLKQTQDSSLLLFMDLSKIEPVSTPEELPMTVVIPAFMISELKTAFQMGFLIYLPFLLVDIVVACSLMSMGMMMLPPMMISMPFKLLLFILVDGWGLTVKSLITSFQ